MKVQIILSLTFLLLFTSANTQMVLSSGALVENTEQNTAPLSDWQKSGWSGDDEPYLAIQNRVDKQIKRGRKINDLLMLYKASAQPKPISHLRPEWQRLAGNKPQNPVAVYGWVYVARKTILASRPFREDHFEEPFNAMLSLNNLREALQSKQFSKLFFLVGSHTSHVFGEDQYLSLLISIGEKLRHSDPNDTSVRYRLIVALLYSSAPSDLQKALSYSQNWVRSSPDNANAHVCLAGAYKTLWVRTQNTAYAKNALTEFHAYLHFNPTSENTQYILRQVAVLERITNHWC